MSDLTELDWNAIEALARSLEPKLRLAFLRGVREGKNNPELDALLSSGQIEALAHTLVPDAAFAGLLPAVRDVLLVAAKHYATEAGVISFKTLSPWALKAVEQHGFELIQQVAEATREGIRAYVRAGLQQGALVPSHIRDIIGLTARQAQAVFNYRRYLSELDPQALERALRDKRFDATVARALELGQPLDSAYINKLVARYEANFLAYRADTIARTESLQALALGRRTAWNTAIATGAVQRDQLEKRWVTAKDSRVRHDHREMEGVVVGFDDEFELPDGRTTWGPPFDPNCRCVCWIRPAVRRVI